jgi:hypothetical protein
MQGFYNEFRAHSSLELRLRICILRQQHRHAKIVLISATSEFSAVVSATSESSAVASATSESSAVG